MIRLVQSGRGAGGSDEADILATNSISNGSDNGPIIDVWSIIIGRVE